MVLEGYVEVEAVGSVGEAHPDEGASAPLIHDLDDEVSGAAGVNSERYKWLLQIENTFWENRSRKIDFQPNIPPDLELSVTASTAGPG